MIYDPVESKRRRREQTPAQDRYRIALILEIGVSNPRKAVKVTALAHLGPGGLQTQRNQGEEKIDNPDPEIIGSGATE